MLDNLNQIKIEVLKNNKKLKDLAKELNMEYNTVIKILNGFIKIPKSFSPSDTFFEKVEIILNKWKIIS